MRALKQPCNQCPFRREHPAGWLGGYAPGQFVEQIQRDGPPIICHKTFPPEDGADAAEAAQGKALCAGALIFAKNICKVPRHPGYGDALQAVKADRTSIFAMPAEFLDHHRAGLPFRPAGTGRR